MMKLFKSDASPYARKAHAVAIEKGVASRIKFVTASPLDNPPDLIAANPLAKIPALVLDDGTALYDSPVICEYLDTLDPQKPMIPASGAARWKVLCEQARADGVTDAALLIVLERRRPEAERSAYWQARWRAAILRGVAEMAREAPKTIDLGAIATGCALGYLDFRLGDIDWRTDNPSLADWFEALSRRPSMRETAPKA